MDRFADPARPAVRARAIHRGWSARPRARSAAGCPLLRWPARFCNGFYRAPVARRTCVVGIKDQTNPDKIWYQFLEKLNKLAGHRDLVKHEACKIPAGMREAFNQTQSDWIGGCNEDNRYLAGRLPHRIQGTDPVDQD